MQALVLCGFSVANYVLLYVTSILLARTLSVADFDDYNVAVSSVLVLTSLATLGLEKYALRCLPAWHNHQDWARSSGFLQFSRRLILVTSLVLVVLFCVTLELTLTLRGKPYHVAIVILAMFLPATAMFQFILEVAAAYGGAIEGGRLLPDLVSGAVAPAQCWRLGFARGKRRRVCHVLLWRRLARRHCRAVPHDAKLLDRVSGALPDCARRLREHDLFAIAHLYAFHQSGPHRASRARGKRRAEPGAVHSAQRSLRGARRGHCLRGSRLAFACRLVAVRALRSRPLQACDVARDSCASAAHPLRAAPPRRTCRRAPTGWHPEAAPRRRPCRSPGLESTASPWLPPPRCWRSHD